MSGPFLSLYRNLKRMHLVGTSIVGTVEAMMTNKNTLFVMPVGCTTWFDASFSPNSTESLCLPVSHSGLKICQFFVMMTELIPLPPVHVCGVDIIQTSQDSEEETVVRKSFMNEEDPSVNSFYKDLSLFNVDRKAYFGGAFIGNHVHRSFKVYM